MKHLFIILVSLGLSLATVAQDTPQPASAIFSEACSVAGQEGKLVFIMFHASWCGWCHRMDTIMNLPELKPLFDKNFVIRHLVVLEGEKKKHLENPGAADMMSKYNGAGQGIPFWLIFSPNGKLLADSRMPSKNKEGKKILANVGCPAQPEEVKYFTKVLKKHTSLGEKELDLIAGKFLLKKPGS